MPFTRRYSALPPQNSPHDPIPLEEYPGPKDQDEHHEVNNLDTDKPKGHRVLRRFTSRVFAGVLTHAFGITMSSVVIFLNSSPRIWMDDNYRNHSTISKLLQFVAEIHEIFVVVSLTAMVLNIVRRRLVDDSDGVPLGWLTAPYRLSDIKFLFSGAFTTAFSTAWTWALGLFFILCMALSLVAGPASAIGLVPTQGWFKMATPFANWTNVEFHIAPDKSIANPLWPTYMNRSLISDMCLNDYTSDNGHHIASCPASGLAELNLRFTSWSLFGDNANVSMREMISYTRRQITSETYNCSIGICALATTPSQHSLLLFGTLWESIKRGYSGMASKAARVKLQGSPDAAIMQPLAHVRCSAVEHEKAVKSTNETEYPRFVSNGPNWYTSTAIYINIPRSEWESAPSYNYVQIKSMNTENLTAWKDYKPSIALLAFVPYVLEPYKAGKTSNQTRFVVTCTGEAQWLSSQVFYEPSASDLVYTNITSLKNYQPKYYSQDLEDGMGPSIAFAKDWTDALYLQNGSTANGNILNSFINGPKGWPIDTDLKSWTWPTTEGGTPRAWTASQKFFNQYQWFWPVMTTRDAQNISHDSLPGIQFASAELGISAERMDVDATNSVRVDINVQRYGWGSGMPGPALVFSSTIMGIYLTVVFLYFSFALVDYFCWHPYTIKSWDTLQELTLLALRSKRPGKKLEGAGAAVKWSSEIWLERVKIKADPCGRVEMSMEEANHLYNLKRGVEYY